MVLRERLRRQRACLFYRLCLSSAGGQVPQSARASLAQHPARGFSYWMEEADNARVVTNGAKRESKECFLEVSVAIEKHPLVLKKGRVTRECARKCFSNNGPGRSPALCEVLPHGTGVLLTADRPIAIVIDLDMFGPPNKRNRKVGSEAKADCGTQALGP